MKIESNIKEILSEGTFEGNKYFLPKIQLDRKDYMKCNEVLETIGMEWNRGQKAHIGDGENLEETFRGILETGEVETLKEYRDRFQFFPTPDDLADYIVELANIKHDNYVLEPSAGKGAILNAIRRYEDKIISEGSAHIGTLTAFDINNDFAEYLTKADEVWIGDFLQIYSRKFDRIIMNPPFSNSQDAKHILHAYSLLKEGGTLVSIASSSIQTREGKLYDELRALPIEWIEVESGAFKESGTMVNTVILRIKK